MSDFPPQQENAGLPPGPAPQNDAPLAIPGAGSAPSNVMAVTPAAAVEAQTQPSQQPGLPEHSPAKASREMGRRTRRGFLGLAAGAAAAWGGWEWIWSRPQAGQIPAPLRDVLHFNEAVSRRLFFSDRHLAPSFPLSQVRTPIRTGSEGEPDQLPDLAAWRLHLAPAMLDPRRPSTAPVQRISLAEIQALPRVELIAEFKCIEGWSRVVHWTGVRFRDFARHFGVFAPAGARAYPYVALTTADEGYYVGFDRASILHPQTLLAYQMNGRPLTLKHGAPLRLVTTVKYGIKNIKWLSRIQATTARPPDYWAQRGYDWYAGL